MARNPNVFCGDCGAANPSGARFCRQCGQALNAPGPAPQPPASPPRWRTIRGRRTFGTGPRPGPFAGILRHLWYDLLERDKTLLCAVLSTICCIPGGIVAIVYAAKVRGKQAQGDMAGAADFSRKARFWIALSVVAGIVFYGFSCGSSMLPW